MKYNSKEEFEQANMFGQYNPYCAVQRSFVSVRWSWDIMPPSPYGHSEAVLMGYFSEKISL